MDTSNIVTLVISLIASVTAVATNKAANKAATRNTEVESRTTIEADAYTRARKFDTDTIARQDGELKELRETNEKQEEEIKNLRKRVEDLENELHNRPPGGTT